MLQNGVGEEAKLSNTELFRLKRSGEAAVAAFCLFIVSDSTNREVAAARPGSSEAARERREASEGFTGMGEGVCVIEGGPKDEAQKQLGSLPLLLVQLLALWW